MHITHSLPESIIALGVHGICSYRLCVLSPPLTLIAGSLSVMRTNLAITSLLVRRDFHSRNWSPTRKRISISVWSGWSRWVPLPRGNDGGEESGGWGASSGPAKRGREISGQREVSGQSMGVSSRLCLQPTLCRHHFWQQSPPWWNWEGQCAVGSKPGSATLPFPGLGQGSELSWASFFLSTKWAF